MKQSLISGLFLATLVSGTATHAHSFHTDVLATAEVTKNISGSVSLDLSSYTNDEVLLLDFSCSVLGHNGSAETWLEIKDINDDILITYKGCFFYGTTSSETGGVRGSRYLPIPVGADSLHLFSDLRRVVFDSGNQATLTAKVLGEDLSTTNLSPNAQKDRGWSTTAGIPATFYPLSNDNDPDGDPLTITNVWQLDTPNSVVINVDGSITFTSGSGYTGADYFYYSISDGNGGTSTSSIQITVNAP